ncbi:hypothetical protein KJ616_00035 [Patescibacteria group bacterium]|nr:hypothetical protein [Patescibacteria group bacterium]
MKINFNKQTLYTLIIGMCVGAVVILATLILTGGAPWLRAAGVGTGAPDINARYLDGYGTATATSSSKIYISTASGYMPTGSIDTGAILDATITSADILDETITSADILNGTLALAMESKTGGCDGAPCTATCTCSSGYIVLWGCCDTTWPGTITSPAACTGFCGVGGTSCSCTHTSGGGAGNEAACLIYCGTVN